IELVGAGPNAALVAALGSDASWNVAADWGLGEQWQAVRVPIGIKFRRSTNGLVTQEVVIARGADDERLTQQRLLARSRVPARLIFVERGSVPHNRLAPHFRSPHAGRDS
ncbi:MAG TPA: hypothetical protein VFW33_00625, partial [Gemmataceae bacterium]|nr:hypothetical protein [Gemmataceae bacterium]